MPDYPPTLAINPVDRPMIATVQVPGSKSLTNRALVLAALAGDPNQGCRLDGALHSEDTEVMVQALDQLGFTVTADWPAGSISVHRPQGDSRIPKAAADLFLANSGTSMRFLTAMVALGQGRYRLDGVKRMRERPIADLLQALHQLGVHASSEANNGCPPVWIQTQGWRGQHVRVRGDLSSQFLSGLLLAAPFADAETFIQVDGPLVSVPYVAMTVAQLRQWGLTVEESADPTTLRFRIPSPQSATQTNYTIEPDASAASYFWASAAITGGRVKVRGLNRHSLQGDVAFVDLLAQMGCSVSDAIDGITVEGGDLHGIDVDMNAISDTVMTLAAVGCFASSPTHIRNVSHIRHKETDRITAIANELRRVGATVHERADGLTIIPAPMHGATVETYNDHRMAMSLALIGLRVPGIVIDHPACVAKTYPNFFHDLAKWT